MCQNLRALAAISEDQGPILMWKLTAVITLVPGNPTLSSGFYRHQVLMWYTGIYVCKIYIHIEHFLKIKGNSSHPRGICVGNTSLILED